MENALENIVYEVAGNLFMPQYVNLLTTETPWSRY